MLRQEKGITLVALIITIIILIILAAVTIMSFTETDMVEKTTKGVEDYARAQELENGIMSNIVNLYDSVSDKIKTIQTEHLSEEEAE